MSVAARLRARLELTRKLQRQNQYIIYGDKNVPNDLLEVLRAVADGTLAKRFPRLASASLAQRPLLEQVAYWVVHIVAMFVSDLQRSATLTWLFRTDESRAFAFKTFATEHTRALDAGAFDIETHATLQAVWCDRPVPYAVCYESAPGDCKVWVLFVVDEPKLNKMCG